MTYGIHSSESSNKRFYRKIFILTRFGIGIFDEAWFEHRIRLFETITLPSFEHTGVDKNFYWVIAIDADMPRISKEKFMQLVSSSSISINIHILEVDYYFEFEEVFKDFIKKHCNENELVIQARFDADDAIAIGFFEKLDEIVNNNNAPMLITFPNHYEFWLEEKKLIKAKYQFYGMNTFLVTADRDVTSYQIIQHQYMEKWAESVGYKVLIIDTKKNFFLRLSFISSDNQAVDFKLKRPLSAKIFDSNMDIKTKCIRAGKKISRMLKIFSCKFNFNNQPIMNILPGEFGISISKLNEYYETYPVTPRIGITICYDCEIYEKAKKIKARLCFLNDKVNLLPIETEEKNNLNMELKTIKQAFIKERLADSFEVKKRNYYCR